MAESFKQPRGVEELLKELKEERAAREKAEAKVERLEQERKALQLIPPLDAMEFHKLLTSASPPERVQRIKFNLDPTVSFIENRRPWTQSNMAVHSYQPFTGEHVTDDMLDKAAELFNENYGVWGELSNKPGEQRYSFYATHT